jgi:hypothetical protein
MGRDIGVRLVDYFKLGAKDSEPGELRHEDDCVEDENFTFSTLDLRGVVANGSNDGLTLWLMGRTTMMPLQLISDPGS